MVTASFESRVSQSFKIDSAVRDITGLVLWTIRNTRPAACTISPGWFSWVLLEMVPGPVGSLRGLLALADDWACIGSPVP